MLRTGLALIGIALVACTWTATFSGLLAKDAERIDEAACVAFGTEITALGKSGIPADIERGAEWGKANLTPERLRQIARYIFLEERLTFRCPNVLAAGAVRQMEEQARLKALAAVERERLWLERMKKIPPPVRRPETKIARAKTPSDIGVPPLPVRKSR